MTSTHARVSERVPVEPLRRAYQDSGLTLSEVCRRIGWMKRSKGETWVRADVTRLARALGLRPDSSHTAGTRYRNHNRNIGVERALVIAEGLRLPPHIIAEIIGEPEPDDTCPGCGERGTWTDSWAQERCEQCWAIVRAGAA